MRRVITLAFICSVLSATLFAQAPATPTFRTGTDLVNLAATVTDTKGAPVDGLTLRDFSVYEDGKLETIAHFSAELTPVSLGIVLDVNPNMFLGGQMPVIRSAISRLLSVYDGTDSEFFVLAFAHDMRRLAQ